MARQKFTKEFKLETVKLAAAVSPIRGLITAFHQSV